MSPLGIVVIYKERDSSRILEPEETDCYNIHQIRPGRVYLTDKADEWMTESLSVDGKTTSLHLSRYDGRFYAWDDIELITSVNDLSD